MNRYRLPLIALLLIASSFLSPPSAQSLNPEDIDALLKQVETEEIDGRRYARVELGLILQLAQERGTNIQSARRGVEIARRGVVAAEARNEALWINALQQGQSVSLGATSNYQTGYTTLRSTLRKATSSGVVYNLSYTDTTSQTALMTRSDSGDITKGDFSDPANSVQLSVSADIPLIQDWGAEVNDLPVRFAEVGVRRSELGVLQTENLTLKQIASIYWDLVGLVETNEVQKQAVTLSERLLRDNKARLNAGILKPIDVSQAETQLLRDQQALRATENSRLGVEDQVRAALNLPELPVGLLPEDRPGVRKLTASAKELLDRAYAEDVQLAQLEAAQQQTGYELLQAENQDATNLDLNLSYVLNGYSADGSATSDLSNTDLHGYSASLTWTLPLGGTAAKEGLAQKRLAAEQNQLQVEQRRSEIQVTLQATLRALDLSRIEINTTQSLLKLTQDQLQNELERFRLGQSTSFQVAQLQQDVAMAQQNEILARIRYEKTYLELLTLTGSLHSEYELSR